MAKCRHKMKLPILCIFIFVFFSGEIGANGCGAGKFGYDCGLECHCDSGENCAEDGACKCELLWDGPTCQIKLENIALNRQTEQGPNTKKDNMDQDKDSKFAVDGNMNTSIWVQSDKENSTVFWSVDLGQESRIDKIVLHFYDPAGDVDRVEKRRPGWTVTLSNSSTTNIKAGILCHNDTSPVPADPVVTLTTCSSPAKYVNIFNYRPGNSAWSKYPNLELSEVQVLSDKGCSVGTYGPQCEHQCGHCENKMCDRIDGTCEGSCADGYYGGMCNMSCPKDCKGTKCAKDYGKCESCQDGFHGDYCNKSCPENCAGTSCLRDGGCFSCKDKKFHTIYCNVSCNQKCNGGCDQSNGNCIDGCIEKFYGPQCKLPCDNCKTGCEKDSGKCTEDGCELGYHGDLCEKKCAGECVIGEGCERKSGMCGLCEETKYGDHCEIDCNANCIAGRCHRNGTCKDGCKDNHFHGNTCDKNCSEVITNCMQCDMVTGIVSCMKCSNAMFGEQCENKCPSNCEKCNSLTECTHCVPGFSGTTCTDVCKVDKCKRCNTSGICAKCEDGFFGSHCESTCPDICQTCTADTSNLNKSVCTTCKKGYFLFRNTCLKCFDPCISCSAVDNCTECGPGFYGSRCDEACPGNCYECTSKNMCTKCNDGWSGKMCQCSHDCFREGDLDSWCYENGTCAKGCIDGRMGDKCDLDCPHKDRCLDCDQRSGRCDKCVSGLYGRINHCDKQCGNCLSDTSGVVKCEVDTGKCIGLCSNGYYGEMCTQNCSNNCIDPFPGNTLCEKTTGECSRCKPGYYGSMCDQKCSENCLDQNVHTDVCNKGTGACSACKPGYHGKTCTDSCSPNCESSPGVNECDKDTGRCSRCKQKYYGEFCDKPCGQHCESDCNQNSGICDACKSNHYGNYCNLTCSQNCGVEPFSNSRKIVCLRFTGECLHCIFGFYGDFCDETCPKNCARSALTGNKPICHIAGGACRKCQIGYFGDTCENECSRNCKKEENSGSGSCDQQLGHCDLGCMPGWHNSTCEKTCNSSCKDHTCHMITAKCLHGCEEGFEGVFCEKYIEKGSGLIIAIVVVVILAAIAVFVGVFLFRRYRRKKAATGNGKVAKNGTKLQRLGRPEEINPLLNGSTRLKQPSKGGVADEELFEEDETAPVVNSDPSEYYNSNTQVPVSGFTEYLQNRKRENPDWYKLEFNKLPKGLLKPCDVATSFGNRGKCRYKQLYPYDATRVKLEPEGDDMSDFINASYVNGYKKPQAFIAAQGPTENTVNDFWRMIFQKDCGKIVMLTNLFEECKMKCVRYYPEADEPQTYGKYEVTMISESELPNYTVRHLQATHGDTKEIKDFQHLHFTAWPDRGVPDNPSVMLNFRDKVMSEACFLDGPILVHCSAGIGRTGTFVALDYLLKQAHIEPYIDVFRTVYDMRYQRTNFVQTDIQYEFVHNAISEALNTKESEVSDDQFNTHYRSMQETCPGSDITKLEDQFEMIHQMSPILDESCFSVGRLEENILKNRYPDILPLDMNRAYLSTPVKGSNEYINAVFVPTCSNKTGFLITQMPLPHTVTDFWRLVYDQHVSNIVMMNNVDDDDDSIGEYWPSDDSTYGPFRIELISCDNSDDFSVMNIQLTHSSLSRQTTMKVKLFRYEGWPDGETLPLSTTSLTSLISQVSRSPRDSKTEPIIVHCMDGAERSGLYCAVSSILERLQMEKKVNIPQTVLQLRARRPQLIKSFEQFDFCYQAVRDYLDTTQIYSNVL